jgi:hypothetical protein
MNSRRFIASPSRFDLLRCRPDQAKIEDIMVGNRQPRNGFCRCAEISGAGVADNLDPIVHTADAFDPTAQEAAR